MTARYKILIALALAGLAAAGLWAAKNPGDEAPSSPIAPAKPALSVTVVQPRVEPLARRLTAQGNVAAWQEASIGAEAGGLRLIRVVAQVGDKVKQGQVLAEFAAETPRAEAAQARATLAEAEAAWKEAADNATRARSIEGSGALSPQQLAQYLTAEHTTRARLEAARAGLAAAELRVRHTQVRASDDGVISYRAPAATLGAVVPQGHELFRLIRQHRLEWRAEVAAGELPLVRAGQPVQVVGPDGSRVEARVRMVAPTVDPQTRNALVYVDLPPAAGGLKAGMYAKGAFELGATAALTLPRQAVVTRDGYSYVFHIGAGGRVVQTKITPGRQSQDRVEILAGLAADAQVVGTGAGFLNDGDLVQVVQAAVGPAR